MHGGNQITPISLTGNYRSLKKWHKKNGQARFKKFILLNLLENISNS